MSNQVLHGGCQCSALRYEVSGEPLDLYVCHCRECQRQAASAFGISVIVPYDALRVTQGQPRSWSRPTDTGNVLECAFCPQCGSRLWHQRRGSKQVISVKGGSLDEPPDLRGVTHIWTSRMLPGVVIPEGSTQFPEEPPR